MIKSMGMLSSILALAMLPAFAQSTPPLRLTKTIELTGVTGKFDHFAIDLAGKRLFAAATGNHSVEIIDLETGKVKQSITGLSKPHGLAWIASLDSLYVADGGLGELRKYSGTPLTLSATIRLSDDADDLVYEEPNHLLFVGHGGSDSANPALVAVVDAANFELKTNISVSSHPEALDADLAGGRVFVNIAGSNDVVVLNGRAKTGDEILAHWKLIKASDNVPLAYDAEDHLLYVACRNPATLVALDAESGKEVVSAGTVGGADDLFYDRELQRVYVIGGAGKVEAFQVGKDRSLHSVGTIQTTPGAKTALFVPSTSLLYVGIPGVDGHAATIQIYATLSKRDSH